MVQDDAGGEGQRGERDLRLRREGAKYGEGEGGAWSNNLRGDPMTECRAAGIEKARDAGASHGPRRVGGRALETSARAGTPPRTLQPPR